MARYFRPLTTLDSPLRYARLVSWTHAGQKWTACYDTAEGGVVVSSAYGSKCRAPGRREPETVAQELRQENALQKVYAPAPTLPKTGLDPWKL